MKLGEKLEEKFSKELYKQEVGDFYYLLDGEDCNIIFKMNKKIGWKIVGIMFFKEIIEVVEFIFYKIVIVFGILLIIGGIVIYFIIVFIIKLLK